MKNWVYLINLSIASLISEKKLDEFKEFLLGDELDREPDLDQWDKL